MKTEKPFDETDHVAGAEAEEGELTAPVNYHLPRTLDPDVTMEVVQRYVESERARTRRVVFWTSTVFLFIVLLVLAVFITVGIVVLRHSRRTSDIVDGVEARTELVVRRVHGITNRMGEMQEEQSEIRHGLASSRAERLRDSRVLQSDLKRFSHWVAHGNSRGLSEVATLQQRLEEMEAASVRREQEFIAGLTAIRSEYSNLLERVAVRTNADVSAALSTATEISETNVRNRVSGTGTIAIVRSPSEEHEPPPAPPAESREKAVVTFPNGDRYEGQFRDGLFDGWGTYYFLNGDMYEGEFRDDMMHGTGTFVFENGDRYEGEFQHGMKHGHGRLMFHGGDTYVGEFHDDTMEGKGTLTYRNGNRYSGDFKNGLKDGSGVFTYENGDVYKGEFRDDERNGRGTYVFADGAKYVGEFKDGRRHGTGRYVYVGGEEYLGEFRDGYKHGRGVSMYPGGGRIEGVWENDEFVRPAEQAVEQEQRISGR